MVQTLKSNYTHKTAQLVVPGMKIRHKRLQLSAAFFRATKRTIQCISRVICINIVEM